MLYWKTILCDVIMQLRLATIEDAAMLLEWRNDAETRANSITQDIIMMDSHVAWLTKSLQNPMRELYIAEEDGQAIGTVRVDILSDGAQELSWTVAPSVRGKGFGKQMIGLALQNLTGTIRAHIKLGNVSSIKIAEACGFQSMREHNGLLEFEFIRRI